MTRIVPLTGLALVLLAAGCSSADKHTPLPTGTTLTAPALTPAQAAQAMYIDYYAQPKTAYTTVPVKEVRSYYATYFTGSYLTRKVADTLKSRKAHLVPHGVIVPSVSKAWLSTPTVAYLDTCNDLSGYSLVDDRTNKVVRRGEKQPLPRRVELHLGGDGRWRISDERVGEQTC